MKVGAPTPPPAPSASPPSENVSPPENKVALSPLMNIPKNLWQHSIMPFFETQDRIAEVARTCKAFNYKSREKGVFVLKFYQAATTSNFKFHKPELLAPSKKAFLPVDYYGKLKIRSHVSDSGKIYYVLENRLFIVDIATEKPYCLDFNDEEVTAVVQVSQDEKLILLERAGNLGFCVYDLTKEKSSQSILEFPEAVQANLSLDGNSLAYFKPDRESLYVQRLDGCEEVKPDVIPQTDKITGFAFSGDGQTVAVWTQKNGEVSIWRKSTSTVENKSINSAGEFKSSFGSSSSKRFEFKFSLPIELGIEVISVFFDFYGKRALLTFTKEKELYRYSIYDITQEGKLNSFFMHQTLLSKSSLLEIRSVCLSLNGNFIACLATDKGKADRLTEIRGTHTYQVQLFDLNKPNPNEGKILFETAARTPFLASPNFNFFAISRFERENNELHTKMRLLRCKVPSEAELESLKPKPPESKSICCCVM